VFDELDRERRRIEGALHDGVQQDLVAASVSIQLALQLLATDPDAARALLEELEQQLEEALGRVRELAHEVYPSLLEARGLAGALRGRGVEVGPLGRYPLEVEEAVYFACRALGTGAETLRILEHDGAVRLEAAGSFEEPALAYARRRFESVGGQLAVSPGGAVSASVPASSSASAR
jgi:hypothetical protein